MNDAENPFALDNSTSFKRKASLLDKATDADGNDRSLKNAKIVVPLKYLSIFFRSLEMPLINCKIHLELNWKNNCVMYGPDYQYFKDHYQLNAVDLYKQNELDADPRALQQIEFYRMLNTKCVQS